jgi:hypothetical protein
MGSRSREIHARTASVVFSGLIINYPLQIGVLYILLDIWGVRDSFWIATYSTMFMTVFAYIRVYIVNRYFSRRK